MGVVGAAAHVASDGVALMLYRSRAGGANMWPIWICSGNATIGNLAVVLAAAGVVGRAPAGPT